MFLHCALRLREMLYHAQRCAPPALGEGYRAAEMRRSHPNGTDKLGPLTFLQPGEPAHAVRAVLLPRADAMAISALHRIADLLAQMGEAADAVGKAAYIVMQAAARADSINRR
jgi:hypothetical protein